MTNALEFASRNPGWQSFNHKDRATRDAIARLYQLRLVEVNIKTTQYCLATGIVVSPKI